MKKLLLTTAILFLFKSVHSQTDKRELNESKKNDVEVVFASHDIRPGNLALTTDGRLFISMNPLVSPKTKVFELQLSKNGENGGVAYPDTAHATGDSSILQAVIGIRADSKGNLWLLDLATKQFIIWNTSTNTLVKTINIPSEVIVSTSFLQDFIIDEKNNRVIIADMTQGDLKSAPTPAFIVINTESGEAKRMAQEHPSLMPEVEGGFAFNPIAIDPNFEYVYFGALHGKTIYRAPANSFSDEETLKENIEKFGTKSFSDGIAVDSKENVYITNIEKSEIGVYNKKEGLKTLATLPKGQSWPDGINIHNGYVYVTVDQLNRTAALNNGEDISKGPFLVVRTKMID